MSDALVRRRTLAGRYNTPHGQNFDALHGKSIARRGGRRPSDAPLVPALEYSSTQPNSTTESFRQRGRLYDRNCSPAPSRALARAEVF